MPSGLGGENAWVAHWVESAKVAVRVFRRANEASLVEFSVCLLHFFQLQNRMNKSMKEEQRIGLNSYMF